MQRIRPLQTGPSPKIARWSVTLAMFAAAVASCPPRLWSAEIHFARQREPYYVGEPVVVQVAVEGLEAGPEPECRLRDPVPGGLVVQGPQVNRSSRSFTQIMNGRMSTRESRDYRFTFTVTAEREGDFPVGPFEVSYDGTVTEVAGERFRFGQLQNDPDMQLEWSLPSPSVYVGQEFPVTVRWLYAGELAAVQYAFSNLQIRSPLFDQFTCTTVPPREGTRLQIATAKGNLAIPAEVRQETRDGREFVVVEAKLNLRADDVGQHASLPLTCRTKKVTQWGRSFFGEATPRDTVPALAAAEPIALTVRPIPVAGRPPSFSGAVGEGFSIDVAANRSVVRVGDPISLTVTLRGTGNLESLALPDLSLNEGVSSGDFQLPTEQPAGSWDGSVRQFQVTVRVRHTSVTQVPPVAFSWFDPVQERFVTTHSKPVALQVLEAQVITADDVVSSGSRTPRDNGAAAGGNANGRNEGAGAEGGLALVGANLAIVQDPARLSVSDAPRWPARTVAVTVHGLAIVIVAGSILWRRLQSADPTSRIRTRRLRSLRRAVETASTRAPRDAADQLARTLRAFITEFQPRQRREVEQLVARCEMMIYAVGEPDAATIAAVAQSAREALQDDWNGP